MRRGLAGFSGCSLAFLALVPTLLWASEEHGHAEPHGIPWGTLLLSAINFGIFVYFVFGRGILPAARRWAEERRERVVRELEEAGRLRAEAERLRAEWEQRMANLEGEVAQIRAEAVAEAQRERERILAAARTTAAVIEADAQRAAAQEVRRVEGELREEVASQAIAGAVRILRERISADDQQRFVDEFVKRVAS